MFRLLATAAGIAVWTSGAVLAQESAAKPNLLVIFGDDIGQTNISAYSFGLMGYATPNIDRIADEGMMFTDYYAEQNCTAGRSTFITGQSTLRTGLSKVGIPRRHRGPASVGRHHGLGAKGPRLRHRAVRQEPPRRPRRVPADRARLRRVLRQPLPPQRRGGARAAHLAPRSTVRREVRPALGTFKELPPAQRPQSFSIDQIVADMEASFASITAAQ